MMTEYLHALDRDAKGLVTDSFLSGEKEFLEEDEVEPYLEPLDRQIDLSPLDEELDDIISKTSRFDAQIDGMTAPRIHQALDLTRREGSDSRVWQFLTIAHRPDFVRHRWEFKSRPHMRLRFIGGREWDSNTLSRLWWAAELTFNGDYSLTERVFERQAIARALFDRNFSHYRPAVEAFISVLADAPQAVIEESAKRFNKLLTVRLLESASEEYLCEILEDIRSSVEESTT